MSDMMAVAVYRAAYDLGLRIPEDLSIIGYDGIPMGEYVNPPLTTVNQNFTNMGKTGVELINKLLREEECDKIVYTDFELIKRGSVI
jgi:DNA-binding LacI/PurR family transcriptional regulator